MGYSVLLSDKDGGDKRVADKVAAKLKAMGYRAIDKHFDYGHPETDIRDQYKNGRRFDLAPEKLGNEEWPQGEFKDHLTAALESAGCSNFTLTEKSAASVGTGRTGR